MNKEVKQLIVLGNGFDLACGLKTTYREYFDEGFGIKFIADAKFKMLSEHTETTYNEILASSEREAKKCFTSWVALKQGNYNKIASEAINDYIGTCLDNIDKDNRNLRDQYQKGQLAVKPIGKLNSWDLIAWAAFVCIDQNSKVMWNDVETMLFNVVTWVLKVREEAERKVEDHPINNEFHSEVDYLVNRRINFAFEDLFNEYSFEDGLSINTTNFYILKFKEIIEACFSSKIDKNLLASEMLNELYNFEEGFSRFINKQTGSSSSEDNQIVQYRYYNQATKLFEKIISPNLPQIESGEESDNYIDVLNFNYSLDERFKDQLENDIDPRAKLTVNSWTNIHGVASWCEPTVIKELNNTHHRLENNNIIELPKPIFGIDNHGILSPDNRKNQQDQDIDFNDVRSIFTKSFRLLDNHINQIRATNFQDDINVISFFGHSLSHADYSYFESIFDMYHIMDNKNVKLKFYYYPGDIKNKSDEEIRATIKRQERQTIEKVVKLLTSYGRNYESDDGENIVNRLILEQRLSVLPNPQI